MRQASSGDEVRIHFTGKLNDGRVFATSKPDNPMQFEIGNPAIMPCIQEAVIGMTPRESKTVMVPPDKGFGPRRRELIQDVNKVLLPDIQHFQKGMTLKLCSGDGETIKAKVREISNSIVTLDLNHPLAGKSLIFEITLLDVS